ncbi:hypothetical protein POM88_010211 [Heracleum sosnowskyi]|uniref:Uncharacterized protein n=1 Tax=Heracleum sosnowskyi TaxID=360622 RepID=A0AAD8JC25_9APIA|nr:hypothetical protein POM88_010211 [Heracleum sosnowskyi]
MISARASFSRKCRGAFVQNKVIRCDIHFSQCNKLTGLNDLYEFLGDLLQSPMMHSCDSEDVLGASIRLLDMCNTTKDAFPQMRASVQDLESSFRRREANLSSKI